MLFGLLEVALPAPDQKLFGRDWSVRPRTPEGTGNKQNRALLNATLVGSGHVPEVGVCKVFLVTYLKPVL
jgi:hypothetical protein